MTAPVPIVGDEGTIVGGAYAGERCVVVQCDNDAGQVTVELSVAGRPTRMAFDVLAILFDVRDPRKALRHELETHFERAAREDMIGWFAQREPAEDPVETDELACLYQIATPVRRAYLAVLEEFDGLFGDALSSSRIEALWKEHRAEWLSRLSPPVLDDETRERGLARMNSVREALPVEDDTV